MQTHPSREVDVIGSTLVVAVGVLVLMTNVLVPTLVGAYVDSFGLSVRQAGYTAAVYMAGGGLGALFVSAALLSVRTRVLLAAGLIALLVGNLASAYVQSLEAILAMRLLAGLGEGAGFALMAAGVSRMRNPSRVYGVFVIAMLIAAAGFQFSVPWLRSTFGVQGLFVPIAVAPACVLFFIRKFPDLSRAQKQGAVSAPSSGGFAQNRTFWFGALAVFVLYCAYGAGFAYVERIGVHAGNTQDEVARTLGSGHLLAAGGALAAIVTANMWRRAWKISGALALVTCSTLLMISGEPGSFALGVTAWFFFWQYFAPNLLGLLAEADPSGRLAAASMGTMEWGLAAGPAIAATFAGEGAYTAVGTITAGGYFIGVLLLLPVIFHVGRSAKSGCRPGSTPATEPGR